MSTNLYCTKNDCFKENKKLGSVEYLIVHSPAVYPVIIRAQSGAGGGWYKRWNKPGVEKLVHGFIDDTGVYNFAPFTMSCWHVGNGYGNTHCIGYELCELQTASEFDKVWDNAVGHYAALCKQFSLTADKVIGHCEAHKKGIASNHSDPEPYFRRFGKSMTDFRAAVQKHLSGAEGVPESHPAPAVTKTYSPWAHGTVCNLTPGDTLNVRTKPDADAARASIWPELGAGNEVDVIEAYDNGWVKINIQGTIAYVNATYLKITGQATAEPAGYTEWAGMASGLGGSRLNVRTGPGTGHGLLSACSKLGEGNMVSVIGESGGWYQVRISNPTIGTHIGWVSKNYIKEV